MDMPSLVEEAARYDTQKTKTLPKPTSTEHATSLVSFIEDNMKACF